MTLTLIDEFLFELNRAFIPKLPGEVFCDGAHYPEMVMIAAGKLGDTEIKPFFLSRVPVTPENWYELFCFNANWQTTVHSLEYGDVLQMTRMDILSYFERLSGRTGRRYRLPTRNELEYVIGAGSSKIYYWEFLNAEGNTVWPDKTKPELMPVFVALDLPPTNPDMTENPIREMILGEVDTAGEYIEIFSESISMSDKSSRKIRLARIGKPVGDQMVLQLIVEGEDFFHDYLFKTLFKQLKRYLTVSRPWQYAIYHCGTSANFYSALKWEYHEGSY